MMKPGSSEEITQNTMETLEDNSEDGYGHHDLDHAGVAECYSTSITSTPYSSIGYYDGYHLMCSVYREYEWYRLTGLELY
jgi:hypothetical protein